MDEPVVSPSHTAHRFKRWLVAEHLEQFHGSYEIGGTEHQQHQGEPVMGGMLTHEPMVAARGEIRREGVTLLAHYGTSYGLFDEWIADYACVLVSDAYRLGEYVGDHVWVSGPLTDVIGGMPVMKVNHLKLLKMKWMR